MLIVGNWKMNTGLERAVALASEVAHATAADAEHVGVTVCPPFVWLDAVAERVRGARVGLGAQNVHPAAEGAYTGEVSTSMLADLGCRYAIVGHSERRALFGETDAFIAEKARALVAAGLTPIVCVGETLDERDAGREAEVVLGQLDGSLDGVEPGAADALVVAYEPVWAIGTGRTASPEQAQQMHALIRARLAARYPAFGAEVALLYGGSVKADNAAELFAEPDLDGALVGGASLDAASFAAIVAAARAAS
jgi:triosephosphate isomerase